MVMSFSGDVYKLEDLARNASRPFKFSAFDDVVFINTGDVLEGAFLHSNISSKKGLPGQAKKGIKKNDILLSEIRPANKRFAYVYENLGNYVVSTKFMVIEAIGKASAEYLYILLTSNRTLTDFQRIAETRSGTFPQITFNSISHYEFFVPTIGVQSAVVDIIGTLNQKIDLLKQTNQSLEAIAQTIFKSWFVNFDPVHANQQGLACAGIDAETADLFPDRFEDSELGQIPKGWDVASLDQIASYLNGLALQKFPPKDDDWLPVIKIAQLRKGDCEGADKAGAYIKPEYIINDGDVLFSWSGTLEVDIWCGGKGALNQHLFKVTSAEYKKWFYYYWTKYHLIDFRNIAAGKATTMGHIQRSHLHAAKVVIPSLEIMNKANDVLQPIIDKQISNAVQVKNLSSLRDTLLPRLISGKLDVSAIEAQLEEMA